MALRLKRGSTADRTQLYFEEGELVYDVDLEQVFVGTGLFSEGGTIGGVPVGNGGGGGGEITGITDNTTGPVITLTDVQSTFSNDIFLEAGTILTGTGDIDLDGSITTDSFLSVAGQITGTTVNGTTITATTGFVGDVTGNVLAQDTSVLIDGEVGKLVGTVETPSATIIKESTAGGSSPALFLKGYANTVDSPNEPSDFSRLGINFSWYDGADYVDSSTIIGYHRTSGAGYIALSSKNLSGTYFASAIEIDGEAGTILLTAENTVNVTGTILATGGVTGDLKGSVVADDSTVIVDGVSGTIPYTVLGAGAASTGDVLKFDGAGWIASPDLQGTGGGAANVSAATQADPVVITTDAAHGFGDGQKVTFTDVVGMTELNGNSYFVNVTAIDTFALYTDSTLTTTLDGSAFTAYVSGGSAAPAPATDAVTLDGQFASYYLDYANFTNTPTIPTDTGDLTNGAGFLTAETNDLTANVTWANIPDANVPASAVTQHQEALSITESQISDLQAYLTPSDIGSFAFSGSILDTSDSSGITITPAVTISSDLTVENDLTVTNKITVETLEVTNLITAGSGTPEITSDTDILLAATDNIELSATTVKSKTSVEVEGEIKLGKVASNNPTAFVPAVINAPILSSIANNDTLDGTDRVKEILRYDYERYTSGGEILIAINDYDTATGADQFLVKKFLFHDSAGDGSAFTVTEIGTSGNAGLFTSLTVASVEDAGNFFLTFTLRSPDAAITGASMLVTGQTTFTSNPLAASVSGY